MKFQLAMINIFDLEKALDFWIGQMGFYEIERQELDTHRKSFIQLKEEKSGFVLQLDYKWDKQEGYESNASFGHFAFEVEDIYSTCQSILDQGLEITFPPADGKQAYINAPDNIEIGFYQKGKPLPVKEPWLSMEKTKKW
jgi:lactoylglutathione lyase